MTGAGALPAEVDVLVVGGGPAGLAAAVELRRRGVRRVLVVDREPVAGGVPRHCAHTGFGLRDLRRLLDGPGYALHRVAAAASAGALVRAGVSATDWAGPTSLACTAPTGRQVVTARAVLLATGCRERPRAARLVPGDRPGDGVLTTGELQQRVHLLGERFPGRAVVVGAEHVSFSAVLTLAAAGARVAGLVTAEPRHQSYPAFAVGAALGWRAEVWASTEVRRVVGRDRLEAVELVDLRTGASRLEPCDLLVFTGDWVPDAELARAAGAAIDPATRGPAVDDRLATGVEGVFAAGNLVHPAEVADLAALGGRWAAAALAATLAGRPGGRLVPVRVAPPLRWVAPQAVRTGRPAPAGARFRLRSDAFAGPARLEVRQGDRLLAARRVRRVVPNRPLALGAGWTRAVDPGGPAVQVALRR